MATDERKAGQLGPTPTLDICEGTCLQEITLRNLDKCLPWGDIVLKNEFTHHRTTIQSPDLADAPLVPLLHGRLAHPLKTGFTVGHESVHREFVNVSLGNPEHRKCGLIRGYQTVFVIQQDRRLRWIRHL